MSASDGGKGSDRRPGHGYQDGWDRIFGQRKPAPAPAQENYVRFDAINLAAPSTSSNLLSQPLPNMVNVGSVR